MGRWRRYSVRRTVFPRIRTLIACLTHLWAQVIFDRLHETAFRGTPLGRTILGTADNIRNMTRDSLVVRAVHLLSLFFLGSRVIVRYPLANLVKFSELSFQNVHR